MEPSPDQEAKVQVVGRSLIVGFFVVLCVLVASAVLSLLNWQAVLRDNAWVDHSRQVMQAQAQVSGDVSFVESSARGFVVSLDPEFQAEFQSGKLKLFASITKLKDLTQDSGPQQAQLNRLQQISVQRTEDLEQAMLRHQRGLPPISKKDPRRLAILDAREKLFQILNGIHNQEQVLMNDRREQSDQSVTWAYLGFWSSSLMGLIALTGFFAIVVRYADSMKRLRLVEVTRAADLEDRVRERTTELSLANKDLEAFSYSVSHDLRAPLRAMHGYASILKKDSRERLTSDDVRMLDRIQKNCTKMSELTESLLALFRVGKVDLMIEEVNLSMLAAEVVQDMRAEYPGVPYEVDIEPGLKALGDRQMLRALLVNLLGNAMKFSSAIECPKIEVTRRLIDDEPAFVVQDNGAGFDPSQSGLLFEPFQRLHKESEFSGNGIGLAMCRKIVSRHRGSIWLESAVGRGTTVFFRLSFAAPAREASEDRVKVATA